MNAGLFDTFQSYSFDLIEDWTNTYIPPEADRHIDNRPILEINASQSAQKSLLFSMVESGN